MLAASGLREASADAADSSATSRSAARILSNRTNRLLDPKRWTRSTSEDKEDVDRDHYRVVLMKAWPEEIYGIAYRYTQVDGLLVSGVIPDQLADQYNQECPIKSTICCGDVFLSVNGVTTPKGMVEQLCRESTVEMVLQKSGPRWHLLDTAQYIARRESNDDTNEKQARNIQFSMSLSHGPSAHHHYRAEPLEEETKEPVVEEETKVPLRAGQKLSIFLAVLLPSLTLVVCLSDIGFGLKFYAVFVDNGQVMYESWNMIGNGMIGMSCMLGVVLYVLDYKKWKMGVMKATFGLLILYSICLGAVFKVKYYPQTPLVIALFHLPVFLGIFRGVTMRKSTRRDFYIYVCLSTFVTAFVTMLVWMLWMNLDSWDGHHRYNDETKAQLVRDSKSLYDNSWVEINGEKRALVYEWDCSEKGVWLADFDRETFDATGELISTGYMLSVDERDARAKACANVKTTWFLVWLAPWISVCVNTVISLFCLVNGVWLNTRQLDTSKLEKVLKQFTMMIAFLAMTMWVSASVAAASMRLTSTIMAFCGSGLLALMVWIYMEVGKRELSSTVANSRLMKSFIKLATSDWVKAMSVIAFNVMIPSCVVIDMLNQKVRQWRGTTTSKKLFTDGAEKFIGHLSSWHWSSVLTKSNLLVMLYWTMSIGVAKITYVFLSWMNETLLQVDLIVVIIVFFVVGLTMFLLPPVPGIPVYVTSGIVISARARTIDGIGFWGGVIIAIFESFILKLVAVCGQYMIGVYMGKSVKVQQLVAVDKVFTRAIEKILKTRGLNLPKVSVLVGGPDWPTSVLCGILRLNLLQCVIGTVPVILVSTPCVLAGAFMTTPDPPAAAGADDVSKGSASSIWSTLYSFMLGISAMVQMASGVLALYFIQEYVHRYGDELAEHRPEHNPVAALTRAEAEYERALAHVSDMKVLPPGHRCLLLASSACMLCSLFFFMFMDEACFRPFEVNSRICDDFAENGLQCDVLNLVKGPGWLAMSVFFVACALHFSYTKVIAGSAKRELDGDHGLDEQSGGSVAPGGHNGHNGHRTSFRSLQKGGATGKARTATM
eukprot:TRINITY_DN40972_c0_g1_i1.p1 TRINITY_DN40972_c0_g1~~TRINITY_DN40972_c0_g1_i1.p1  ORF type:complete len:1056 (+),score=222.94 TRINITY_DN40972_c0_g1_i1:154-3321(+)